MKMDYLSLPPKLRVLIKGDITNGQNVKKVLCLYSSWNYIMDKPFFMVLRLFLMLGTVSIHHAKIDRKDQPRNSPKYPPTAPIRSLIS